MKGFENAKQAEGKIEIVAEEAAKDLEKLVRPTYVTEGGFVGEAAAPGQPDSSAASVIRPSQPQATATYQPLHLNNSLNDWPQATAAGENGLVIEEPTPALASVEVPSTDYSKLLKLVTYGAFGVFAIVSTAVALVIYSHSQQKPQTPSQQSLSALLGGGSGAGSNSSLHINFNTVLSNGKQFKATGPVLIQNTINSTDAFKIQDASGSNLLVADTLNSQISIGNKPPGNVSLSVNGDILTNGALVSTTNGGYSLSNQGLKIGNLLVCAANGCVSSSSPPPTPAFPTIDVANLAYINATQVFTGNNSFNGNNTYSGQNLFKTTSTAAFQIQNAAGASNLFVVDTANNRIGVGTAIPGEKLDIVGGGISIDRANASYDTAQLTLNNSALGGDPRATIYLANDSALHFRNVASGGYTFTNRTASWDLLSISSTGATTFQNSTDSTTAFQVQSAGGASLINVNSSIGQVTIGSSTSLAPFTPSLSVVANDASSAAMKIRNTAVNGYSTIDFYDSGGAFSGSFGYANSSASYSPGSMFLNTNTASTPLVFGVNATEVARFDTSGNAIFKNTIGNSTTAFQVQNATGTKVLGVDTNNSQVSVSNSGGNASSDEFNSGSSPGSQWTLYTDDASTATVSSGNLVITPNPSTSSHDCWQTGSGNYTNCLRLVEASPTTTGNIQLDAKLVNEPGNASAAVGIIAWQDASNFLRFEYNSSGAFNFHNVLSGTGHSFVFSCTVGSAPVYMRVIRQGNLWTLLYSTNGVDYFSCGSIDLNATYGVSNFTLNNVGVDVIKDATSWTTSLPTFDFFRVSQAALSVKGSLQIQAGSSDGNLLQISEASNLSVLNIKEVDSNWRMTLKGTATFQSGTNSTTAFQVQNATGVSLLTVDTTSRIITIAGDTTTFGNLTITNAHFKSTQTTAPTIGTPTNCGTGSPSATITAGSTDSAGSFTIASGGGTPTTCDTVLTFNKAYGAAPKSVIVVPTTTVGTAPQARVGVVSATSTTSFTLSFVVSGMGPSEVDSFYYWVIE